MLVNEDIRPANLVFLLAFCWRLYLHLPLRECGIPGDPSGGKPHMLLLYFTEAKQQGHV